MPMAAPKPCTKPGCTKHAVKGGRCAAHKHEAWDHKGKTSSERGYGKEWRIVRKQALARDGYMCVKCRDEGVYTKADEVDHILPRHLGGKDNLSNLQGICKPHHKQKTAKESKAAKYGD